jgi:hypothetical protein
MVQHYGEIELDRLAYDKNRPALKIKKQVPDIARHYREQLKAMQTKRAEGHMGLLDFLGWGE